MMSCRCGVTFCWICRKDITNDYGHTSRFEKLSWHLGCNILIGDTALSQGTLMFFLILLLPFWVICETYILSFGYLTRTYFPLFHIAREYEDLCGYDRMSTVAPIICFGLGILFIPFTVLISVILTPLMFITRVHQLLKLIFNNCIGFCCLRISHWCCCCLNR